MLPPQQKIIILDFGSQYTQLIARRVRELKVYCEIHPPTISCQALQQLHPAAIILSGGPASVYAHGAPTIDSEILLLPIPLLGICYGLQLLAQKLGGRVVGADKREYGSATITLAPKFHGAGQNLLQYFNPGDALTVWMSHGDHVESLPPGFLALGSTASTPFAIIAHDSRPHVGLQFHPEVVHTPQGMEILRGFLFGVAKLSPSWTMEAFLQNEIADIHATVGHGPGAQDKVICALSGGVDSSVVAVLLHKALGERLIAVFVDNGLLRQGEVEEVKQLFLGLLKIPLRVIDARQRFLQALKGVVDPERKRKIIGNLFIEVFEEEARAFSQVKYLAQGTLYPDVIESVRTYGPSQTIKSHHNVGGLPERMHLKLIEPLRELFKDEVRALGKTMGIPEQTLQRQPFPGPGLAIRILGEVTDEQLSILQQADAIVREEIEKAGRATKVWQSFAVLLPVRSVGVMGDERTYDQTIAVRCVDSVDGMTADWSRLSPGLLATLFQPHY